MPYNDCQFPHLTPSSAYDLPEHMRSGLLFTPLFPAPCQVAFVEGSTANAVWRACC